MSEHAEQVIIFQWAQTQERRFPCLRFMYGTLNGVRLNMGQAIKAKRAGNRAGVPDIVLPYPCDGFYGLYVELKTKTGTVQKHQREYIEYLNSVGYFATVCRGSKDAIQTIENYVNGKKTRKIPLMTVHEFINRPTKSENCTDTECPHKI